MIGGQYLTLACCDLLEKWPLLWQRHVKGKGSVSEDVSSHHHMDLHLYGAFSIKVGNAKSFPSNLLLEGSKRNSQ